MENYRPAVRSAPDARQPIDANGVLDNADFKDATGLGKAVHDNARTTNCLVNRVYTYATGRAETANEGLRLNQLLADWTTSGYKIPALMKRITLDPGFYRVTLPQEAVVGRQNHNRRIECAYR